MDGCRTVHDPPAGPYAYLLGMYLGDGCISLHRRAVEKLRVKLDARYPGIVAECDTAMAAVLPNKVGHVQCPGCVEVWSYSKHWSCLFPQHGPGKKHERPIVLRPWQAEIVARHRRELLRGLIHSDGCRVGNTVNGTVYPRYQFSNRSEDILRLFTDSCDALAIPWRRSTPRVVSVSRRAGVAALDGFIGPKR